MRNGKIIAARLWSRYRGDIPSRTPIILGMAPDKYDKICIYLAKDSQAPNVFEQNGCKVFYISGKPAVSQANPGVLWKLVKILKEQKVDILHCHRYQASVYGAIAAWIASVPVVFSHVHGINRTRTARRKLTNRIIFKRVDKILTVGDAVRDDVLKTNPTVRSEQVISLGNSIDYGRFTDIGITKSQAKARINLKPGSVVFGTVGRLVPTKGLPLLIEAFANVKRQISTAVLVIIGQGRLRDELQKSVLEKSLSDCVHFLGHRDDIAPLLRAMDVFVLASVAEGLPRSLLEAMASSLPCIAADVGGIAEIITHRQSGYLVDAQDAGALAEAMLEAANLSGRQLEELTENARATVMEKFSHSAIIKKLEKIYGKEYAKKNPQPV